MRVRGVTRLQQAYRWGKSRFARRALILAYHRVSAVPSDPWRLCVSPDHFAEHLEVLRGHGLPISLRQLRAGLQDRRAPARSVALTFDDGYADNLQQAKPLLERHDVPATVFVVTGNVASGREFWPDELEKVILQPGTLPESLSLKLGGEVYDWHLGADSRYGVEAFEQHLGWSMYAAEDPTARHRLYRDLWKLLQRAPLGARREALDELLAWGGVGAESRPTHRPLTREEVSELEAGGLVEVGAHTVNHPVLAALPAPLQRAEVEQAKLYLEEALNHRVESFAYPYGGERHYTVETVDAVRAAGFTSACSTRAASVSPKTDPLQLPRVFIADWDGEEFERRLSGWFYDWF